MQYCRNDSNFLNYQRHCYNPTSLPALNTATATHFKTWNTTETFEFNIWMEAIFISEHLVSVSVCDGRLLDIADWMKQEIFVRLSHDYFTKCQILQPMSYRWADRHTTSCFRMMCIDAKYIKHSIFTLFCYFLKGYLWSPSWLWPPGCLSLCDLASSPWTPSHNPCTRRDSGISQEHKACKTDAEAVKFNQHQEQTIEALVIIQTKVSFSAAAQIFFSFLLLSIFFIQLLYLIPEWHG